MSISCFQGARALVQLADADPDKDGLSNLEIQKILYFANMLHIGEYGANKPLVKEKFLPWPYGPAIGVLYDRLKKYDGNFVAIKAFDDIVSIIKEGTTEPKEGYESPVKFLNEAYKRWGKFKPYKLIGISHWGEGAWKKTIDKKEKEIDSKLIKSEFEARYPNTR